MLKLSELKPPKGATKNRKRLGRGTGSTLGKTCGRGHKGQKSRSGGGIPAWFEGGTMPLTLRLPKRGFNNIFGTEYQTVNLIRINRLGIDEITPQTLKDNGVIKSLRRPVKVLGAGKIEKAIKVKVDAVSKSAEEKIKAAGGSVERTAKAKPRRGQKFKKKDKQKRKSE